MDIRYPTNPIEVKRFTTQELRQRYLVEHLFTVDELNLVYTHHDRMIVGSAVPMSHPIVLTDEKDELRTNYFLERRELGVINIGGAGTITVDGNSFELKKSDCVYIGKDSIDVVFNSLDKEQPAKFYLISTLAHKKYPTKKISLDEATPQHLGDISKSNERTIYQYIHANGLQSCQLMMGMTILEPNNMWNTMPPHLHDRRTEIYCYFDMNEDARVFHFMGEPNETRHLVVSNQDIVISPSWSIHSGIGTNNYTFIWAMAGENYTFDDMDIVKTSELK